MLTLNDNGINYNEMIQLLCILLSLILEVCPYMNDVLKL